MSRVATTPSSHDLDAAVEVRISTGAKRLEVQAYTHILTEVRLSLEEVDRLALPGRTSRLRWGIADLQKTGDVVARLAPIRIPSRRPSDSVSLPGHGLVDGLRVLQDQPQIPELFSPGTVTRVQNLGRELGSGGVDEVQVVSMNGATHTAIIDEQTVDNAKRAITATSRAQSSVIGILDVLHGRDRDHPRAQVFDPRTKRAVTIKAKGEHIALLREAYMRRVMATGQLTRNSAGQAVRLELSELHVLPDHERPLTAWEILGVDPDFTGSMATEDFVHWSRRG